MADNTDKPATSRDEDLDELKREIANLKAAIAEQSEDVSQALRDRARVVRDNPGTVSGAMVFGGVIGLLVGLALGDQLVKSHPDSE